MIEIIAFPRVHITLIGMNFNGYRINGGIGIALARPNLSLIATPSKYFQFVDKRKINLQRSQVNRLCKSINEMQNKFGMKRNIAVTLTGEMPTNSGFGSGTAIRLACTESLFKLNEIDYTEEKLIKLSGRGGTSGIGIHTYFHGGFVLDIGHKNNKIAPSSLFENSSRKPLILKKGKMPKWDIGVCIPTKINTLTQREEEIFFKKTVPISQSEVYKTLYEVIYGIYSSINDDDTKIFSQALIEIQECTWKKSERNIYGKELKTIENQLYKCGATAVGMSSLGPSLFFISDDNDLVIKKAQHLVNNSCILFNTRPRNSGRKLKLC